MVVGPPADMARPPSNGTIEYWVYGTGVGTSQALVHRVFVVWAQKYSAVIPRKQNICMGSEILVLGIFSNTSALRAIRSVHVWLPPHVEYFKVVKDIPPLDAVCMRFSTS